MNKETLATELRQEADRLTKAADLLAPRLAPQPVAPINSTRSATKNRIGKRRLSREQREKLSAAQQARRARERQQQAQPQAA